MQNVLITTRATQVFIGKSLYPEPTYVSWNDDDQLVSQVVKHRQYAVCRAKGLREYIEKR